MHAVTYPVHPEPFTVEDLYALPDDGARHELVDGALVVSPPPTGRHQLVVSRLVGLLLRAKPDELEVLEGPGVRLTCARLLQPDLIVGPRAELTADVLYFPPHAVFLAVEVMSPSSMTNDRVTKPTLYAEAGIPTYVRVEPTGSGGPAVYAYRLEVDVYREHARAGQRLELDEPFPVSFDPAELIAS